ncbi:exodeoxyribonuclease VII small subunit (plasmid) [Haloplanus rallus]|jgi:exodeoxyribonuclease VII small subunit|uniref:Exodeoxyribonuclease VII small subunit n=3 Tax=Halobacteriales TaxID=2235 RepID=A0A1H6CBF8_9EURY|nr:MULTISPECIES: exodeoxyribonuclease VII small subunit [Halobacteria]QCC49626.1 exodeoxyribonuclease VII small subunit [Halobellus limi]QGX93385.1 exodeoxyribonuclease VII small subunit [Haloplanus rallus]SEG70264.1 Exodeoxyribonuclease VII small subunit [Halobellus limi]SEP03074.1 Exodeoxyribonuclease VII small subunit [Halorientalis persicus]
MAKDPDIKRRMDRVEEIIDQLDADEVSLEDGRELYDEGQELLAEIREQLQDGDGEVIEIE